MQNIINYDDKTALYENPSIPDINKVNASDMNEIKLVVNGSLQGTNAMGSIVVDDINCKNLFDKNNYNSLGGFINSSTSKITGNANTKTVYIPIEANTTYTVSKTKGNRFAIATTSTIPAFDISLSNIVEDNTATSLTLTSSSSAKYLVAYVYNSGADTDTLDSILATLQIEVGSTATTYTPYKKIIKEENGYVKENTTFYANDFKCRNLLPTHIQTQTTNGVTITKNSDGSITLNGTSTAGITIHDYFNFTLKAGTYTHSISNTAPTGLYLSLNNVSATMIGQVGAEQKATFTIAQDTTYPQYLIYITSGMTFNNFKIYPQIEVGSEATPYTEHKNFENEEIYSTNEMVIGRWIDGKPLYRKVFTTTSYDSQIDITSLNVSEITNLKGFITLNISNALYTYNTYFMSSTDYFRIYSSSTNKLIYLRYGNQSSTLNKIVIIVEYTKTTD